MKRILIIATLLLSAGGMTLLAGESELSSAAPAATKSSRSLKFSRVRNDTTRLAMFERTRPQGNKEIPVPHFCIHTEDNSFVLSIGGQIKPIVGVDLGNNLYEQSSAGINFITNSIPVPAVKGHRSRFYINCLNADIDFQVVGLGGQENQITGYVKFGTNGNTNALQLKDAYVSWRGFTAGRKSTLFKDGRACQPPTIDPQGPCGMVDETAYEVSYISPYINGFRGALGVATPTYYHSSGRYYGPDFQAWGKEEGEYVADPTYYTQNIPDVPVWIEWSHSKYNRVRLSAILRNFVYRDVVTESKHHAAGWGVMLSGNYNPIKPLVFYFTGVYGKGIGNYIQDLSGLPLSFTPSSKHLGRMRANPMMGLMLGASYNFKERWQFNMMASEARIWGVGPYAEENATENGHFNDYKYGFYYAVNGFYNITSYLQVGLEYLYGQRMTWNYGSAHDNRIQTQFMLTF